MLSMAHVHARGYAQQALDHPDVELVGIWDDRGQEAAADYNVAFVADLDEMLGRDDVQGVIVDAPTNLHHDVILRSIKAGKHVFTEKALSIATAESDEIVAAADAS